MNARYNNFNRIHKALRALLADTLTLLQQTDFADLLQKEKVINQLNDVVTLFGVHADKEDHFILEPITHLNKAIAETFEHEHVEDHKLAENLLNQINVLKVANDSTIAVEAQKLLYSFIDFTAFNLTHMNKEEFILNDILWANYSDDEIKSIEGRIVATISIEISKLSGKWMMRALNNQEIIEWLSDVKKNAPAPVFDTLLSIAHHELPPQRFEKIISSLN